MSASDEYLVRRLQGGDERALSALVGRHHLAMVRVARLYARQRETAEEVVQDAWIAVIEGIAGFEARASFKSWVLTIVANKARTRARRDGRTVLLDDLGEGEPGLDPDRFDAAGHWARPVGAWDEMTPERLAGDRELVAKLGEALDRLPPAQRAAVLLRDVEGLSTLQACNILGVAETNLRVLLHRARTRLRVVLEDLLAPDRPRQG
jgi:RNA polymerase sigma-70 factor (ECF subfamily)